MYYLDTLTTDRDLTEIAYSYVYPKLIEEKLWRDAMIMLDTLDLTELLTYSETDSHMLDDAKDHVGVVRDVRWPRGDNKWPPLQPYHADAPMELVHMDYLTIDHGRTKKDVNILIITDHYSRFAQAIKTPNQTALATAQAAWDHFFQQIWIPR